MTYGQKQEEEKLFKQKATGEDRAKHMFNALASAGANNERLAKLLIAWDFATSLLKWNVTLTEIVTNYQASIDAEYHKDYKAVATIEELDRRVALRRSMSRNETQGQGLV
jgi:hypothetical protein